MALSGEERRRLALAEVHNHRPGGEVVLMTLQFEHPEFDEPALVVNDNADLDARLETGELVTFRHTTFRKIGPAQGDGRWPEIELSVNVIGSDLEEMLDRSLGSRAPVRITFRDYVRSIALEGPAQVLRGLELDVTTTGDFTVTGRAGFFGLNRRFGYVYDPALYPGLS